MSHLSQIVLLAASVAGFLVGLGAVTTVSQIRSYAYSVQVRPSLVRAAPHVPIAATTPLTHRTQLAAAPVVETAPAAPQARVPSLPLLAAVMGALTLPVLVLLGLRRCPAPSAVSLLAVSGEEQAAPEEERTYYFLVANAKFMLFEEEQAMELLREKRRFLKEKEMPQDFWLVPQPEFLSSMPDIDKRVLKPCCALVSTDELWILFMKLRYDRVLMGSFKGPADVKKALTTKGGDPLAVVPKFDVPADWAKNVPYPKYSNDWFHIFLVEPPVSTPAK
jgi:hypothetical protein